GRHLADVLRTGPGAIQESVARRVVAAAALVRVQVVDVTVPTVGWDGAEQGAIVVDMRSIHTRVISSLRLRLHERFSPERFSVPCNCWRYQRIPVVVRLIGASS